MTKDQIIALAREAGWPLSVLRPSGVHVDNSDEPLIPCLERFAALVAAAEREACAKICDDRIGTRAMARHCADLIRARGEE